MEQILDYIQHYGLAVFVIASCIIFLIGILKICKVYSKIKNQNIKKFIYYITDIVLAFGFAAIYFAIFKLNFKDYFIFSCAQVGYTTTLYAIYENFGIRKIVQIFLDWLKQAFDKNPQNKCVKALTKLGLDSNAITHVQTTINAELANIEAQKKAAESTTVVTNN